MRAVPDTPTEPASHGGAPAVPGDNTEAPRGSVLKRTNRLILAIVAFQLLVPLTYYMRDDPYDERFAWRMFSAVRLHNCQTEAVDRRDEGEVPIALTSVIHRAWVNHLGRNRAEVVHAFLRHRCEVDGVESVQVVNRCVTPDGTALRPQVYVRACASGEVQEPEALIVEATR